MLIQKAWLGESEYMLRWDRPRVRRTAPARWSVSPAAPGALETSGSKTVASISLIDVLPDGGPSHLHALRRRQPAAAAAAEFRVRRVDRPAHAQRALYGVAYLRADRAA